MPQSQRILKPVIVLAFANAHNDFTYSYLPRLTEELRRVRDALEPVKEAGWCDVIDIPNASLTDIVKIFQKYRDRIVAFHYGGHANSYQLLLESVTSELEAINAGGFAEFLSQQNNLNLVFLNGCSSEGQVDALFDAGVGAVIATSKDIFDDAAVAFASSFYVSLASGVNLQTAYNEAVAIMRSQDCILGVENPWQLRIRQENYRIRYWALPNSSTTHKDEKCPYRGLEHFNLSHATNYFGREGMIENLLDKLGDLDKSKKPYFLTVVGPSGSGKSSLIYCGLRKALSDNRLHGSNRWKFDSFRPGADPMMALALPLIRLWKPHCDEIEQLTLSKKLAANLRSGDLNITDIFSQVVPTPNRFLLVIDQFEELFTNNPEEEEQRCFLTLLLEAINTRWCTLILTLRSDFIGYMQNNLRLFEHFEPGYLMVAPMSDDERRIAIEGPLTHTATNYHFEEHLVERILTDLRFQPGYLPLLEFTLSELWEHHNGQGLLTHAAYTAMGGVSGSIASHAEQVFAIFFSDKQTEDRTTFQQLMTRLVRVGQRGVESSDTRQRVPLHELPTELCTLAQWLASNAGHRLLVADIDSEGNPTVEIAHEALIENWARLRKWLEEDRDFLAWINRVKAIQRDWYRNDCKDDDLLRGSALVEAERWYLGRQLELLQNELDFVQASLTFRQDEEDRLCRVALELQNARDEAVRQREIAEKAIRPSIARKLAALALAEIERKEEPDGSLAILLAIAAVNTTWLTDGVIVDLADKALRTAIQSAPPWKKTLNFHEKSVNSVEFNASGKKILTASEDGTSRVWDLDKGQQTLCLKDTCASIWSASFNYDETQIVTGSADCIARLWDAKSGILIRRFIGHTDRVTSAVFSHDNKLVVTASCDGSVRIWEVSSGNELKTLCRHDKWMTCAKFSPNDQFIVAGSEDNTVRIWELESGHQIQRLERHTGRINSLAFLQNGKQIVSASNDYSVVLCDFVTGEQETEFDGHFEKVYAVSSSPNQTWLATSGADGVARVFEISSNELRLQLYGHTDIVWSITISNELIATASADYS